MRHYSRSVHHHILGGPMTTTTTTTIRTEHDNDAIVMPVNDALAIDYQTGYRATKGNIHRTNFAYDASLESILRG